MNDTSNSDITTIASTQMNDYFPPVKIIIENNKSSRYIPVSFEKKLIKYNIRMYQKRYSDGKLGDIGFNIKIDNSKNIIRNRFEILDL